MIIDWLSKHTAIKRIISVTALTTFIMSVVLSDAWAAIDKGQAPHETTSRVQAPCAHVDADTFTIPAYLGEIKDAWRAPSTPSTIHHRPSTVVHIQDAHCNYAAQHRIAEIIEYLNKEYEITTVNLEGGKGAYDLSPFTDIADAKAREQAADFFVKEGVVSGAEYFAVNNPDKINLWGVEDTGLYLENLNTYRESLKYKSEIDKHLKSLTHILNNLKRHMYPEELLELDTKRAQYKAQNMDFKDYAAFLLEKAEEKAIDIKTFTNIHLLGQSLEQEKSIDFKKANLERDLLIERLRIILSEQELEELVLKTVQLKQKRTSPRDFYDYVLEKVREVNIDLNAFPELQKYIEYISTYSAADRSAIMKEINALENKIKETLYENNKQKELDRLSQNLSLTKDLFNITLTRDDYNHYKEHQQELAVENYTRFINTEAPRHKITAKLDEDINKLDQHRDKISRFYEYSFKRDKAFLKNIKFAAGGGSYANNGNASPTLRRSRLRRRTTYRPTQLRTPNPELRTTILITGGFHTENLRTLFKENNISYISIMPSFTNEDGDNCPYFKLLAGDGPSLMGYITSNISAMAIFTYLGNEATQKIHNIRKEDVKSLVNWVSEGAEEAVFLFDGKLKLVAGKEMPNDEKGRIEPTGATVNGKPVWAIWTGEHVSPPAAETDKERAPPASTGKSPAKSGAWFENPTYTRRFAWWVEPVISFAAGAGAWCVLVYFGNGIWAAAVSALVFWLGHAFRGKAALFSREVIWLSLGTAAAGAALFALGLWNLVTLGLLVVHAGVHFFINRKAAGRTGARRSHRHQREESASRETPEPAKETSVVGFLQMLFGVKFTRKLEGVLEEEAKEVVDILLPDLDPEEKREIARELVKSAVPIPVVRFKPLILRTLTIGTALVWLLSCSFPQAPPLVFLAFYVMADLIVFQRAWEVSGYISAPEHFRQSDKLHQKIIKYIEGYRPNTIYLSPFEPLARFRATASHEFTHYLHAWMGRIKCAVPVASAIGCLRYYETEGDAKWFKDAFDRGYGKFKDKSRSLASRWTQLVRFFKKEAGEEAYSDEIEPGTEPDWSYPLGAALVGMAKALSEETGDRNDMRRFIRLIAEGRSPAQAETVIREAAQSTGVLRDPGFVPQTGKKRQDGRRSPEKVANRGGSWFGNPTYMRWFARWVKLVIALAASGAWCVSVCFGKPVWVLGVYALVFWLGHALRGKVWKKIIPLVVNALSDTDVGNDDLKQRLEIFQEMAASLPDEYPRRDVYEILANRDDEILERTLSPKDILTIFDNPVFQLETEQMEDMVDRFSVARSVEVMLKRFKLPVTSGNISKELMSFVLEKRGKYAEEVLLDKDSNVIIICHEETMFDPLPLIAFALRLGVSPGNIQVFKGRPGTEKDRLWIEVQLEAIKEKWGITPEELEKISVSPATKDNVTGAVATCSGNTAIFGDMHGSRGATCLYNGSSADKQCDIREEDWVEALMKHRKTADDGAEYLDISHIKTIIDACYTADTWIGVLNRLVRTCKKRGIKIKGLAPVITGGDTGATTWNKSFYRELPKLVKSHGKLKVGHVMAVRRHLAKGKKNEKGVFQSEHPSIILALNDDEFQQLKKILVVKEGEGPSFAATFALPEKKPEAESTARHSAAPETIDETGERYLDPDAPLVRLIGKYREVPKLDETGKPVLDENGYPIPVDPIDIIEENGKFKLKGLIEHIETGERINLAKVKQTPADLQSYLGNVRKLTEGAGARPEETALLNRILEEFKNHSQAQLILTSAGINGFFGVGKTKVIAVDEALLESNPISLLHEILHHMCDKDSALINKIHGMLNAESPEWLEKHLNKYTDPDREQFRTHYIIRAFTRQAFPELDKKLTLEIKAAQKDEDSYGANANNGDKGCDEALSRHFILKISELAGRDLNGPMSNFVNWLDDIIEQTDDVLSRKQLNKIADNLGISLDMEEQIYQKTISMAEAARDFVKQLPDDNKQNVFLLRDAFALYSAAKIMGRDPKAIYLSKSTFREFTGMGMVADMIIPFMLKGVKKKMGISFEEGVPEEKFPEFKSAFFELLWSLISDGADTGVEQNEFIAYKDGVKKAAKSIMSYLKELGVTDTARRGIRLVDTTMTGTLALFAEGSVNAYLRKKELPEEDIAKKTDTRMFYSRLSSAISFLGAGHDARIVESSWYPVEFRRRAGVASTGMPHVAERGEAEKKIFLFQAIVLRNELLSLRQDREIPGVSERRDGLMGKHEVLEEIVVDENDAFTRQVFPEEDKQLTQTIKAVPRYKAAEEIIPEIAEIIRKAPIYAFEPAASDEAENPVISFLRRIERSLGKKGHNLHARTYLAKGNWLKRLKSEIGKSLPDFYEDVTGRFEGLDHDKNKTRMVIRLLSKDGKSCEKERAAIREFLAEKLLEEIDKDTRREALTLDQKREMASRIIEKKVRFVDAYANGARHLNPVIDLFTDITAVECDRYGKEDGYRTKDSPPNHLGEGYRRLLRVSITNYDELVKKSKSEKIGAILATIFSGRAVLAIKAVNWESITAWKKSNDQLLRSL